MKSQWLRGLVVCSPIALGALFGCGGATTGNQVSVTIPNGTYSGTVVNSANKTDTGGFNITVTPYFSLTGNAKFSGNSATFTGTITNVNGYVSGTVNEGNSVFVLTGTLTGANTMTGSLTLTNGAGAVSYTVTATLQ